MPMSASSWFPCPHGSHVFVSHVLVGATLSWCPCPRWSHVLMVPPSLWDSSSQCPHPHAHVLMELISPRMLRTKSGLFGAGGDCPHRAKMVPREVALQTEDAEPPAPCSQPAKALLGAGCQGSRGAGGRRRRKVLHVPVLLTGPVPLPFRVGLTPCRGCRTEGEAAVGLSYIPLQPWREGRTHGHTVHRMLEWFGLEGP